MSRASLDWSDPIAVARWLADLRSSFNDADAAALDMLQPLRKRELGPALHAEHYNAARVQILKALAYAEAPQDIAPRGGPNDAAPPAGGAR